MSFCVLLPAITEGLFYVIEGKLEGNAEGKQEFLLTALESKFSVPSELKEKIMSETMIRKEPVNISSEDDKICVPTLENKVHFPKECHRHQKR